jgi:hypothetical protein
VCTVSSGTSYLQLSSSPSQHLPGNPERLARNAIEMAQLIAKSI